VVAAVMCGDRVRKENATGGGSDGSRERDGGRAN